jgi:signal recognition particle subunit SRP54
MAPIETLFVVDAMLGQDAVNTAKAFNEALPLTGVILTKLDGDSRGGAALSVRHVTGKPIKFAGVGEKLTGLEEFHPSAWPARILGMGDILGLVEEAQRGRRSGKGPGARQEAEVRQGLRPQRLQGPDRADAQDGRLGACSTSCRRSSARLRRSRPAARSRTRPSRRIEGIINSMTPTERTKPELIKASRKRRIATGAGVPVQEVNRLLNQFEQTQKMMKQFSKGGMQKMMRGMKGMIPGMR